MSFEHIGMNMMVADLLTKELLPKALIGYVECVGVSSKPMLLWLRYAHYVYDTMNLLYVSAVLSILSLQYVCTLMVHG